MKLHIWHWIPAFGTHITFDAISVLTGIVMQSYFSSSQTSRLPARKRARLSGSTGTVFGNHSKSYLHRISYLKRAFIMVLRLRKAVSLFIKHGLVSVNWIIMQMEPLFFPSQLAFWERRGTTRKQCSACFS